MQSRFGRRNQYQNNSIFIIILTLNIYANVFIKIVDWGYGLPIVINILICRLEGCQFIFDMV